MKDELEELINALESGNIEEIEKIVKPYSTD